MIIILLIILVCFLIYKYKNYFDKEYVTVNIYDELYLYKFITYVNKNTEYYNIGVNTNYGDPNILLGNNCGYLSTHKMFMYELNFNNSKDVYTEFGHKINFNDKNLNIEGYYTFENTVVEDKNKNKVSAKYIRLNILKKCNTDLKSMFDKIIENSDNNIKLLFKEYHTKSCVKYNYNNHYLKENPFYYGKKENIIKENLMKPFFHKDSDMLWFTIKNIFLNSDFNKGSMSKVKLLLHGPPGNGKSSFVYRLAMCTLSNISVIDFSLTRLNIYFSIDRIKHNNIFLFENIENSLKEIQFRNSKKYNEFTPNDLLGIIKNPFMAKVIVATTNKYDDFKNSYPQFLMPGKLKPIHFGYIGVDTLQDISMYFFGRKLKWNVPDVIMTPTCDIIDLAFEALTVGVDSFDYFSDKLKLLL